jgi:outer membrane protein OmpA-like peptidoglycan-associated protein
MRYFSLLLFFCIAANSFAQSLLVNGGFEEENICTEYKVKCSPEGWISAAGGFDNYFKDKGRAYEGSYCIAIEAGISNKRYNRTFFRSQLLCGLRKNNQYLIEFYIKSPHLVTDSIGIYLSSNDFLFERRPLYTITPSIFVKDDPAFEMKDDSSWQKVSLKYTATGDEVYFTLANFSRRDINGETGIIGENHFFVYIDYITLIPLDPNENICSDWWQTKTEIYYQDERHNYLQKFIKAYRNNPPEPPTLSKTWVLVQQKLLLPDIVFAPGKSDLKQPAFFMLDSFCQTLQGKFIDVVLINGHTDTTGASELNEGLSSARAEAVASYFRSCNYLNKTDILVRGWAALEPIADNRTPEGRQKNRRVEISLYIWDKN